MPKRRPVVGPLWTPLGVSIFPRAGSYFTCCSLFFYFLFFYFLFGNTDGFTGTGSDSTGGPGRAVMELKGKSETKRWPLPT